jgi:hypothetical protein
MLWVSMSIHACMSMTVVGCCALAQVNRAVQDCERLRLIEHGLREDVLIGKEEIRKVLKASSLLEPAQRRKRRAPGEQGEQGRGGQKRPR